MTIREQILIWKRLSILLRAGTPLPTALALTSEQAAPKSAALILVIKSDIENGKPLWKAVEAHSKVFGTYAPRLIEVGELSGNLPECLQYLSSELRKKYELKNKVLGALIYPALIFLSTLGICILLLVFVFPKIVPIFTAFHSRLPWSTRLLMALGLGLQHHWLAALFIVVGAIVVIFFSLKNQSVALKVSLAALKLPLLKQILKNYFGIMFARNLAVLLKADVRLNSALKILSRTFDSPVYSLALAQMAETIFAGGRLSVALEQPQDLFPSALKQMCAAGEKTGSLQNSLLYAAEIMEDDLSRITTELTSLIEPALMIFMGLLVGFVAISIISPIYSLTQNLHP